MYLSDIFDQLTYGELSSLFMGGVDCSGIQPEHYPQVVSYVNAALLAVYKRFPIKLEEVVIKLQDNIQTYYLDTRFAQTNGDPNELPVDPLAPPVMPYLQSDLLFLPKKDRYIDDSSIQPFTGNVISIEEVFNEDGQTLFLNDGGQYWSVHTPAYNAVQIPYPEKENSLIVVYKASHPRIEVKDLTPETEEVYIPIALLEPFLLYVGARAFSTLNSDQNAEGNNYMAKYEASCRKIEQLGLVVKDSFINEKLDVYGWV